MIVWDRHSQTAAYSLTEVSIRDPAGHSRGPERLHRDPSLLPHPNSQESGWNTVLQTPPCVVTASNICESQRGAVC